jgi:GNAT superfamily N-acetyltransferase
MTTLSPTKLPLPAPLDIQPINLDRDADLCIEIRKDSFIQSYGSAHRFLGDDQRGAERYLIWLQEKSSARPGSCCHLWHNGQVLGQLEVGATSNDLLEGWIFLVYIVSAWRRRGLGSYILEYCEGFLRHAGFHTAGLTVGRSNAAALTLYTQNGWHIVDDKRSDAESLVMIKSLGTPRDNRQLTTVKAYPPHSYVRGAPLPNLPG